jgi:hypothetical protein
MYGAYWCPHCARQKQAFGTKAWSKVEYVECAIPGNRAGQTEACKNKNITGYPTWIFGDESRMSGEVPLLDLARKAGCAYDEFVPDAAANGGESAAMPASGDEVVPDTDVVTQ